MSPNRPFNRPGGSRPGGRPGGGRPGGSRPGGRPSGGSRRPSFDRSSSPREGSVAVATPELPKIVELPDSLAVKDLAELLRVTPVQVIKELMKNGVIANINQQIDREAATAVATELGFEIQEPAPVEQVAPDLAAVDEDEDPALLQHRPPVVTIMGHVDHGKTSLLDAIRETNVTAREAGGITQHIGAYQVDLHGQKITFLDTPGHEAFTAMRARGAQATDIAILVVAADDGVMPQTKEAIDHAKAANVPIVVAINKIDKGDANPDRVKQQLAELGVVPEEYGGETITVPVSARRKEGIDSLLEMILLVAEMGDLKANPNKAGFGVVIEAKLDKARGPVATVLVKTGTLKVGDIMVAGGAYGKVKALFDDKGRRLRKATPAMPAEVLGLGAVPTAGDVWRVVDDEKLARSLAAARAGEGPSDALSAPVSLDDVYSKIQSGQVKELNIIVKTDVQGSVEPIVVSLNRLQEGDVKAHVIHSGTGGITEADVLLASASGAVIIGFNTRPEAGAKHLAEEQNVDIRYYDVIYKVIEDVQKALTGLLEPTYSEVIEGHAEVRQTFKAGKSDVIAGAMVTDGKISRSSSVRVMRAGGVVFQGKISSLRRFKEDAREVAAGYECGIHLDGFNAFQVGDIVESFRMEKD
ncbi:MAG TPA: translation initiation factor IF-2 [Chloroflexota bacterium]